MPDYTTYRRPYREPEPGRQQTTNTVPPPEPPRPTETTPPREPTGRMEPEVPGGTPAPGKAAPGGPPTMPGKAAPGGAPPPTPSTPGKGGPTTPSSATPNVPTPNAMLPDPSLGAGFADPNIRPVAGVNPWQDWAAGLLPGTVGPTAGERTAADWITGAVEAGRRGPTGAGLPGGPEGTSPTFEATRRAFETLTIPQIRQQRTLMGLGDSNAVTNDIAKAWAGVLPGLVESELGREERTIERGISSAFGGAQGMAGLTAQEMARRFGASDRGFGFGTGFRGIAEEANRAIYEDFLRRQGLAERLLFTPFGQAPGTIGSEQQVGGLFK